jgi:hypothetical protein
MRRELGDMVDLVNETVDELHAEMVDRLEAATDEVQTELRD